MLYPKSHIHVIPVVAAAPTLAQIRMSVLPFDSVTLSSQQIMLGETQGKPVTLNKAFNLWECPMRRSFRKGLI
jgi:hypothetical protein